MLESAADVAVWITGFEAARNDHVDGGSGDDA
jgi:hypothetical protein